VLLAGGSKEDHAPAFVRVDATGKIDGALGVQRPPGSAGKPVDVSCAVPTPTTAGCPGETLLYSGHEGFLFR
jgi:hypothetical protein